MHGTSRHKTNCDNRQRQDRNLLVLVESELLYNVGIGALLLSVGAVPTTLESELCGRVQRLPESELPSRPRSASELELAGTYAFSVGFVCTFVWRLNRIQLL